MGFWEELKEDLSTAVDEILRIDEENEPGEQETKVSISDVLRSIDRVDGEIVSNGAIKVDANAIVIGNITAADAIIEGVVRGDIMVRDSVVIEESATIIGDIRSKRVQISDGAVIEGMCLHS